jgi:hypothetical protein
MCELSPSSSANPYSVKSTLYNAEGQRHSQPFFNRSNVLSLNVYDFQSVSFVEDVVIFVLWDMPARTRGQGTILSSIDYDGHCRLTGDARQAERLR